MKQQWLKNETILTSTKIHFVIQKDSNYKVGLNKISEQVVMDQKPNFSGLAQQILEYQQKNSKLSFLAFRNMQLYFHGMQIQGCT